MFKQISNYMDYLFIKAPANLEGTIHPELSFVDARQVRSIMGGGGIGIIVYRLICNL